MNVPLNLIWTVGLLPYFATFVCFLFTESIQQQQQKRILQSVLTLLTENKTSMNSAQSTKNRNVLCRQKQIIYDSMSIIIELFFQAQRDCILNAM